jgi:GTP-binding protein LepA
MQHKVQAQTISNLYLALENDLEIIPVLNKVEICANPEEVSDDIVDLLGCKLEDIIYVGKTGLGVENILAAVIERIPPPKEMLMSHYKL